MAVLHSTTPSSIPRRSLTWLVIVMKIVLWTTSVFAQEDPTAPCKTITEIVCGDSNFDTLCKALRKSGLDQTLTRRGPTFTLFAPTNAAFLELPGSILDYLGLSPENLDYLLLTHAIAGKPLTIQDLECHMEVEMVSGEPTTTVCGTDTTDIKFQQGSGNIVDEDIPQIVQADIIACNGIVHAIDRVILPERLPIMPGDSVPVNAPTVKMDIPPTFPPLDQPVPTATASPPTFPPTMETPALPPTFPPNTEIPALPPTVPPMIPTPTHAAPQHYNPPTQPYVPPPQPYNPPTQPYVPPPQPYNPQPQPYIPPQPYNPPTQPYVPPPQPYYPQPQPYIPPPTQHYNPPTQPYVPPPQPYYPHPQPYIPPPTQHYTRPYVPTMSYYGAPQPYHQKPDDPVYLPPVPGLQRCDSLADVICTADGFDVLCTAIKIVGLYNTLKHGSWTVFAPTDDAFQSWLGHTYLDHLSKDELTNLLLYHLLDKATTFDELECDTWILTKSGQHSYTLCRDDHHKYQMGSGNGPHNEPKIVLTADKDTICNGILHVVDNVILPEEKYWTQYHEYEPPPTHKPYDY
ncbi:beta-Ig-H3/fasciclin [Nitzschia inconspicua]|uniref:Beta-Ig-H3/fasciclin n=1 Tax=Nitzschia inconspicua TaxID=303405 RepID=A0A9K3K3S1_9STRA|nr:beta-Ig-H3/fasciclin [Nitzschia inconspicua]